MKLALAAAFALAVPAAFAAATSRAQEKWQPFAFQGNERYEYKIVTDDGSGQPKETGFGLDIRKSGADFDVTWAIRSKLTQEELNEQTLLVGWANAAPAWAIMNPMYAMFVNDLELKEGEKMSVFGAGTVRVTAKETVGGRTGYACQFSQKSDGEQETVVWEWTVDPALALPIKSVTYEGGRPTMRAELTSYTKD